MCRHNLANHLGTKCNPDSVIGHGVDEHKSTRAHTHTCRRQQASCCKFCSERTKNCELTNAHEMPSLTNTNGNGDPQETYRGDKLDCTANC